MLSRLSKRWLCSEHTWSNCAKEFVIILSLKWKVTVKQGVEEYPSCPNVCWFTQVIMSGNNLRRHVTIIIILWIYYDGVPQKMFNLVSGYTLTLNPKSISFIVSPFTITFSSFKSLWTMFSEWQWSRASITYLNNFLASSSSNYPFDLR